ncbi:MAG: arylesterase [Pseudomonadota bacterium]
MRRIFALLMVFFVPAAQAADAPTVLVVGDSLSAGYGIDVDQSWTNLLQQRLKEQGYEHRVVNASISGDTTEGGAARLGFALNEFSPALVVIELGGNDGLRGISPSQTQANLERMVNDSRAAGAAVVMLGIKIPPNYGKRYIEAFEGVFPSVANSLNVPWVEFFLEGVALNDALMQDDGIHPNAEAQPKLLDNAWTVINQALSD